MLKLNRRLFSITGLGALTAGFFSGAGRSAAADAHTDAVIAEMRARAKPTLLLKAGAARSRIGGLPRLPSGTDWPTRQGRPMAFLAELDLVELRGAGGADWLPADGALQFFYDNQDMPWGFDPVDRDGWLVLHVREDGETRPAPVNLGRDDRFPEKHLRPVMATSYPHPDRLGPDFTSRDYDFDQVDALLDAGAKVGEDHRVGGYPSPIQGDDMELEAQLASNGIKVGGSEGYATDDAKQLEPGAADWRLLLQIDSDDDAEMMWGDAGKLYFWVREQDARAADFSKVWLVLQCF